MLQRQSRTVLAERAEKKSGEHSNEFGSIAG